MRIRTLLPRLALLAFSLLLACAPAGDGLFGRLAEALRLRFPGQAARILSAPHSFDASSEGFAGAPRGRLGASLPRRGEGAIRFEVGPDFTVSVREVGAAGQATLEERAVAYPRAGGTSFWAAEDDGYEEWLLLEASAVRRDAPVAAWELEGATARQRGEAVDVVDERGTAQIAVTAPEAYAASGRAVGARLEARGARVELWVDAEGEAVLVDPAWRRTRPMSEGRSGHTATLLGDGQVLIAGGLNNSKNAVTTAEVYDHETKMWTPVTSMSNPRSDHTATLLDDGRVLVAGGTGKLGSLATAELYDPKTNAWSLVAPMNAHRAHHTATLLGDGKVLVAGGLGVTELPSGQATAELYDPKANTWTTTIKPMSTPRHSHTATRLYDGAVLVTGGLVGSQDGVLATAELYDPASQTWTTVAPMSASRRGHTATRLYDGSILIAGGIDGADNLLSSVEVYVAQAGKPGTWTVVASMNTSRRSHTAALLADGSVLIAGGITDAGRVLATTEVYAAHAWTTSASMSTARDHHTATLLKDGKVLVAGGAADDVSAMSKAEIYDVTANPWTEVGKMTAPRYSHTATKVKSGVLVAGGVLDTKNPVATAGAEVYDLSTKTWTTKSAMSTARTGHTATLLDGRVLVVGGGTVENGSPLPTAEVYDPEADTWTTVDPMETARHGHTATLLDDGRVLVAGGTADDGSTLRTAEVYDPKADTWTSTKSTMGTARSFHTATLVGKTYVLVTGGLDDKQHRVAKAEVYDVTNDKWMDGGALRRPRAYHTATLLNDGRVLVAGGDDDVTHGVADAERVDVTTRTSMQVHPMSVPRGHQTETRFGNDPVNDLVLIAGGMDDANNALSTAEVYSPADATWTAIPPMRVARGYHTATLLDGDRVLIAGGRGPEGALARAEIFQPQAQGSVCASPSECQSGFCVDSICCDKACDRDCGVCSVAIGALTDGVCNVIEGACKHFACDKRGQEPRCLNRCATSDDCDPGYVCEPPGDAGPPSCVEPRSTFLNDACAVSATSPAARTERPSLEPALILLAALAAIRRRATGRAELTRRA